MTPIHERITFASGERFAFEVMEDDDVVRSIPYHRVRAVWRDGELIWRRPRERRVL